MSHTHLLDICTQILTATPSGTVRRSVRTLLDELRQRSPGNSVEVRVPPYAAVQIGSARNPTAPVHRRGTPGSVVELDAVTLARLCNAELSWEKAVESHAVSAHGAESDLSWLFPLS